jgi:hypothetical protein
MYKKIFGTVRRYRRRWNVLASMSHIGGPSRFSLRDDEIALVCAGKNVAYYLPTLFAWHRERGVSHFVYLDNGSEDGSVEIALSEPGVMVLGCRLPFGEYENLMRAAAATRRISGGWRLVVDADELLDWPDSGKTDLRDLVTRENAVGATAVVAQMLEMFPDGQLSEYHKASYPDSINNFIYYDISNIEVKEYCHGKFSRSLSRNKITNPEIKFLFGGIRKTAFGEKCCLTKHPLVKVGECDRPFCHPHFSSGVTCSDHTILIKHYKFTGDFMEREADRIRRNVFRNREGSQRMARFAQDPRLTLHSPTARRWTGPEALVDAGFIIATPDRPLVDAARRGT